MRIDGTHIADELAADTRAAITALGRTPSLAVLTCAPNFATQRFLALKERRAREVGVALTVTELSGSCTTAEARGALETLVAAHDGVIIQLPFPATVAVDELLAVLPAERDVDAIGTAATAALAAGTAVVLPPVVAAIREIARRADLPLRGARVVVVGSGRLVGAPAAAWCRSQGAHVEVLTEETADLAERTRDADVLILGAGVPGLLTADMVKEGTAVFDAGTSEEGGRLVGDAAPEVASVAGVFTPVPGGIGPITVAMIFANLVALLGTHRDARGGARGREPGDLL